MKVTWKNYFDSKNFFDRIENCKNLCEFIDVRGAKKVYLNATEILWQTKTDNVLFIAHMIYDIRVFHLLFKNKIYGLYWYSNIIIFMAFLFVLFHSRILYTHTRTLFFFPRHFFRYKYIWIRVPSALVHSIRRRYFSLFSSFLMQFSIV